MNNVVMFGPTKRTFNDLILNYEEAKRNMIAAKNPTQAQRDAVQAHGIALSMWIKGNARSILEAMK